MNTQVSLILHQLRDDDEVEACFKILFATLPNGPASLRSLNTYLANTTL